jgi:hypothetical protein
MVHWSNASRCLLVSRDEIENAALEGGGGTKLYNMFGRKYQKYQIAMCKGVAERFRVFHQFQVKCCKIMLCI